MSATPSLRSKIMKAIKSRDTQPELIVRRLLHASGRRYRLHAPELPGKPDIVFRPLRKAVFVHGCFWHGHHCPRASRGPKTNADYWIAKITHNTARDAIVQAKLTAMGWRLLVVWECETKDKAALSVRLEAFLNS